MTKVYMVMTSEIVHNVHIELIQKAAELGELTIGIYSDEVLLQLGRTPIMRQEDRLAVFRAIKGVFHTIVQEQMSYEKNLRQLKPDFVIHGDNWTRGGLKSVREEVITILQEWGGELMEYPFTGNHPVDDVIRNISRSGFLPEVRRRKLNYLIHTRPIVRVIEAHNGLTGLIAERTEVQIGGESRSFDAMWVSSLCDSTAKGKPDIELVDHSSRLQTIEQILDVTTKPIILDGDSGGLIEHFVHNLASIERAGVSAVIIEDKVGLKENSLFETSSQQQDTIEGFCNKIAAGKGVLSSRDFSIIARIESLILGAGIDDALERTKAYIAAGAGGIMIHSNKKAPDEIFEFCARYSEMTDVPLVVVPTTYNMVTEGELSKRGVKVVIYANQLLRSAFPAMVNTAQTILRSGRSYEAEESLMPIREIISLIPKI